MRLRGLKVLAVLAVFVAASGFRPYGTNDLATLTVPAAYTGSGGAPLSYRLFVPAIPDTATNGVPLILFLHGSGECGTNNTAQLLHGVGGLVWWSRHRYPVDTNRLLVTGISLGGYGTWDLVCRYPGRFAAAIPVCGAGDPQQAEAAAKTPLWIFHGERDGNVPNKMDRAMVGRLWELDAPVRYMEYPDSGHGIWGRVYSDDAVMKWFFKQARK